MGTGTGPGPSRPSSTLRPFGPVLTALSSLRVSWSSRVALVGYRFTGAEGLAAPMDRTVTDVIPMSRDEVRFPAPPVVRGSGPRSEIMGVPLPAERRDYPNGSFMRLEAMP